MPRGLGKLLFIAVLIGGTYYTYKHFTTPPAAGGPDGMPPMPVSVAVVEARHVQLWNSFSGKLVAVDSAEIRPRVSGTIEKVHFTEGEWVEKGAPLFTIDRRPYEAALQAAQARATLAQAELGRAQTLVAEKAIPQREYDQRKNDAAVAQADLTRAELDFNYSLIKAPIAGRVGRAEITAGNLVDGGGGAPVLTTIVANRPIYADFDIDEPTYLRYLKDAGDDVNQLKNIAVNLRLAGDDTVYTGSVQSFDNQLNPGSGTLRVRAIFGNDDGGLIPGLFAELQMGSASDASVILINERAINTDQNIKFVWVVGEDSKTSYRPVKLGNMAEGFRVVTEGLEPGEKIIINGTQRVMMPGQQVVPTVVPMEGKPEAPATPPVEAGAETPGEAPAP